MDRGRRPVVPVYPRAYGGTNGNVEQTEEGTGLPPRVRGNPFR